MKNKSRQKILNQEMAEKFRSVTEHSVVKNNEKIPPVKNIDEINKLLSQFIADVELAYEDKPIHIVMVTRVYSDDNEEKTMCLTRTNDVIGAEMIIGFIRDQQNLIKEIVKKMPKEIMMETIKKIIREKGTSFNLIML